MIWPTLFNKKISRGFTLVEVLIVVSIIGLLSVSTFAAFKTWQSRNILFNTRQILVQAMHEAQAMAITASNDSKWGIKLKDENIIIFCGNNYEERDVGKDKIVELPRNVQITGIDQIIFNKNTGFPNSSSTTTVGYEGKTIYININSQGIFSY